MNSTPKKIVWILGSGFSVPLGAPTLTELLSDTSKVTIKEIFTKTKFPKLYNDSYFELAYNIYKLGHVPITSSVPKMWNDAEQYLDYLDAASMYPDSLAKVRVDSVTKSGGLQNDIKIPLLIESTRRIIAAECSAFLEGTSPELETWQPYIRWAKMLNHDHTIITFNYDRILEKLADLTDIRLGIGLESFFGITGSDLKYLEVEKIASVVKLHGSVDWKKNTSQSPPTIERGNPLEALICDSNQLVIATPGPTKHKMVSDILKNLWYYANEALTNADTVFFIGYRFPPTDTEALSWLLGALMKNESSDLRLYTVLGPNDDADNRRLEALLDFATKQRKTGQKKIIRTHLWAQDFMSVYNPDFIFD